MLSFKKTGERLRFFTEINYGPMFGSYELVYDSFTHDSVSASVINVLSLKAGVLYAI